MRWWAVSSYMGLKFGMASKLSNLESEIRNRGESFADMTSARLFLVDITVITNADGYTFEMIAINQDW